MFKLKKGDRIWVIFSSLDEPEKALVAVAYRDGCLIEPHGIYIGNKKIMGIRLNYEI